MADRQSQRAGDNSAQVQSTGTVNIYQGMSPGEVMDILDRQRNQILAGFTETASSVAEARINEFERRLFAALTEAKVLGALADPGYQAVLNAADIGAASSDQTSDYDLLAKLMTDRAHQEDRQSKSFTDRAVQVVDKIDDAGLATLTTLHLVLTTFPTAIELDLALDHYEQMVSCLIPEDLPTGTDWSEHLVLLDAVRIMGESKFKPFGEFLSNKIPWFASTGVEAGSEAETEATGRFEKLEMPVLMVDHELKPGYRRFQFATEDQLRQYVTSNGGSSDVADGAVAIANDVLRWHVVDQQTFPALMERIESRPNLHRLGVWMSEQSSAVLPTGVGRALAVANMKRLMPYRLQSPQVRNS